MKYKIFVTIIIIVKLNLAYAEVITPIPGGCEQINAVGVINGMGLDTTSWLFSELDPTEEECSGLNVNIDSNTILFDYAYFMSDLQDSIIPDVEEYYFSIDMESFLNSFEAGNKVTFFKINSEYQGVKQTILKLKMQSINNKYSADNPFGLWNLAVVWFDPSGIQKSVQNFTIGSNDPYLNLYYYWNATDGSNQVGINHQLNSQSPFLFNEIYRPSVVRLGFINTNHILDAGDKMYFYLPPGMLD